MQLIIIYPLALSSRKLGKFNERVMDEGFCPKSIVDMKNKAWYAPVKMAEEEMQESYSKSPRPECTATADYDGTTRKHWGLDKGPVTILADASGQVVLIEYGLLDESKQLEILALLERDRDRREATNAQP